MKARYQAIFLVSIIFYSIFPARAQSAFDEFKAAAAIGKNGLKLPPTNAFELIQNIKYGIDTELFLDDSFFEPENLLLFTNAKSVEGLGGSNNWLTVRQANIKGVQRSIEFVRQNTEEKRISKFAISFFYPPIYADYLIQVFGPITKTEELSRKFRSGHPIALSKKTHLFGNMEICQISINKKIHTEICSLVSGDGQVGQFYVMQTKEK